MRVKKMTKLPKGWEVVELGKCVDILDTHRFGCV